MSGRRPTPCPPWCRLVPTHVSGHCDVVCSVPGCTWSAMHPGDHGEQPVGPDRRHLPVRVRVSASGPVDWHNVWSSPAPLVICRNGWSVNCSACGFVRVLGFADKGRRARNIGAAHNGARRHLVQVHRVLDWSCEQVSG